MTLSVGEQLKQARAQHRFSLKDIAEATKIQPWVLEALERDELHTMMSPVYTKGFVTTYAKCLQLDPSSLVRRLYPPSAAVEAPEASSEPLASLTWPSLEIPWHLVRRVGTAAIGLLVLAVIVKMNLVQGLSVSSPRHEASLTLSNDRPAVRPESLTIPLSRPLELKLIARRPTWVSVEGDGRLLTQRELAAGAQETWKAKRQFKLVIAKPFHVDVILNGHSISPLVLAHHGQLLIHHHSISALPATPGTPELKVQAGVSPE